MSEHTGRCLCGAVSYTIDAELREVINCHCSQCRQFHGHYAAYTAAPRQAVRIADVGEKLGWYQSSAGVRRGYCSECGSSLFWDRQDSDLLRIAAGSLEVPTRLNTAGHIYVHDAADYYTVDDGLPGREQGLSSPLIE